jgi:cellulose biosynthesis protein BcsQ
VLLPFFSMVDRRRALHQELIRSARAEFPQMLATEVPNWSEIERMSVRRAPLVATAPRSVAALIYQQLWREIRARIGADDAQRTPRAIRAARGELPPEAPPR